METNIITIIPIYNNYQDIRTFYTIKAQQTYRFTLFHPPGVILLPQVLHPPWCLASRGEHHQVQAEGSRARREQLSCADTDKYSRHSAEGGQRGGDEPSVWRQVRVVHFFLFHCLFVFVDYLFAEGQM